MTFLSLILVYVLFRVKHFTCDFLLQTDWMALTKGKPGKEGFHALFVHAAIHAMGTLVIVLIFTPTLWWLFFVDFILHSGIDRFKGSLTFQRGWQPKDTIFWWSFGLDQEAHNLTHMAYIIIMVVSAGGITAL